MKSKILNLFAFLALLLAGHAQAAQSVTFYHHDALGSVIAKSDADGYLYLNEEYQPYGEKIYAADDFFGGSDDWYTGKNYSEELDLTYFGARWYDAKQGRFLSIDPAPVSLASIHSFNRYHYANSNPYKYIDPDGREVIVSAEMQLTVSNLVSESDTARSIVNKLDGDPRKFYIRSGDDPSGGSATVVAGRRTSLFERMFLGEKDGPDSMDISINLDPKSHAGFIDEQGNEFTSSAERILGHELGHARIWVDSGHVGLKVNQAGAVDIENKIAKELDSDLPMRHRTKGHGSDLSNY